MQEQLIDGFRLSPQQRRLWALSHNSPAYRCQFALDFSGAGNASLLKAALENVVAKHEILRTTFVCVSGTTIPVMLIHEESPFELQAYDLSHLPALEQQAKVDELFEAACQQPFDFNAKEGSLLAVTLITRSSTEQTLLVGLPALCADLASVKTLADDIADAYAALLSGTEFPLEALQYADISEWLNELLEDEETEAGRAYWAQQELSQRSRLKIPFEREGLLGNPDQPSAVGPLFRSFEITIGPKSGLESTVGKLEDLAESYETSSELFLLACWQVQLWRLSEASELVIGTAFDGRKYEDLEELPGLFAKYLPLSCQLDETLSFSDLLAQDQEAVDEAYNWQEYFDGSPSSDSESDPAAPLFPFMFDFFDFFDAREPSVREERAELAFSISTEYVTLEPFKVRLSCRRLGSSLKLTFFYDTRLFLPEAIEILASQYQMLLQSVLNNPEALISELEMLSDLERQRLVAFNENQNENQNQTATDRVKSKCYHHFVEEQVDRTPNHIAVVAPTFSLAQGEGCALTYRELNRRANQLAHHLRTLGVRAEVPVAICLPRSVEMILGMLAILKAGGAYVPLDPALPQARQAFMLQDTQAPVLLTTRHLSERLPEHQAEVVLLDADWDLIAQQSAENPISSVTPQNLLYVLYTSGSTGKPKGVGVEHRQLVNYIQAIIERVEMPSAANFALVSTFGADLGHTVLFPSLCTGATLHVISEEGMQNPVALAEYFSHHAIDCLKITPSHLEALLASERPEQILPRQRLILGGEASRWELIDRIQAYAPNCVIFNHYGPTETTVGVTTYRVEKENIEKGRPTPLPIGRPLANTQLHILDADLRPVPIGVAGELYIGGAGVSRGYLNRPQLTKERFIPQVTVTSEVTVTSAPTFAPARLYKTGDKARYLADGNVQFLGRFDHQVKIRGFRIELGEIEAVLKQHPQVGEAVVIVHGSEKEATGKRLVAYVVPHPSAAKVERELQMSAIRRDLSRKLPEYMVPNLFVTLPALPLTPNGKIDRRALPAPSQSQRRANFVAPRDVLEQQLAQIWQDVLSVHSVGVRDNFFDQGGHSLLAIRLMALIQQQFAQNLPLATLLQHPTIEQLATLLRQQSDSWSWSPLVPIQTKGKKPPFFCVHGAGGNVIYFYHLARHLGSEQPFYALQALGLDGEAAPHSTIEEMASHYLDAIRRLQPQGPYYLGGHSSGGRVAFEMGQQLIKQGQEVALVAILDTYAPLPDYKPGGIDWPALRATWDDAKWLTEMASAIEHWLGKPLSLSYEALAPLEPEEQLNNFKQRLEMANMLPANADIRQVRGQVQVFKANLLTRYVPQEAVPIPITLFLAEKGSEVRADILRQDPTWGWRQFGPVDLQLIPGDHITMLTEPHIQTLAERLSAALEKGVESGDMSS